MRNTCKFTCFFFLLLSIYEAGFSQTERPGLKIPFGHTDVITAMDISKDGTKIITASADMSVIIWDAFSGKELKSFFFKKPVANVFFSANSRSMVVVESNDMISIGNKSFSLWDVQSGKLINQYDFNGRAECALSPINDIIVIPAFIGTKTDDGYLMNNHVQGLSVMATAYDLSNKKELRSFRIGINLDATGVSDKVNINFIPWQNKQYIICAKSNYFSYPQDDKSDSVNIWDIENSTKLNRSFRVDKHINYISASRENGYFATASDGKITVWNLNANEPICTFPVTSGKIEKIDFSTKGDLLLSICKLNKGMCVQAWNIETKTNILTLNIPTARRGSLIKLSPLGNYFVLSSEKSAQVYDLGGDLICSLQGHVIDTKEIYFSRNSRFLAAKAMKKQEAGEMLDKLKDMISKLPGKEDDDDEEEENSGLSLVKNKMDSIFKNATDKLNSGTPPQFPTSVWNLDLGINEKALEQDGALLIRGSTYQMTTDTISPDRNFKIITQSRMDLSSGFFDVIKSDPNAPVEIKAIQKQTVPVLKYLEPLSRIKSLVNLEMNDTLKLITLDSSEWIILNGKGYYKCSKNAAPLFHFIKNDKVISFEQLDLQFNRPDLILKELGSNDSKLIEAYKKTYLNRLERYGLDEHSVNANYDVPEMEFADRNNISLNQRTGKISLHVIANAKAGRLKYFNIWVNDVPVFGSKGVFINSKVNFDTTVTISLSPGKNKIDGSVLNTMGLESYRMPLFINCLVPENTKPKTWFIGIGINQYKDPARNNLKYTIDDIKALAQEIKKKVKSEIIVDSLFNENFNAGNLGLLRKKLLSAGVDDHIILVYSGHGLLGNDGNYYFPTSGMTAADFKSPSGKAISYKELESLLDGIPARNKLFLIDACHSGIYDRNSETVLNDSITTTQIMDELFTYVGRGTGATVIASSSGAEKSFEPKGTYYRHGFFTQSILEAIERFQTIKVSMLTEFILKRVPQLSNNKQKPSIRSENRYTDFTIW